MNKTFISTAIPYVNAKPHLGHALEYVQTDAYARTQRLQGNEVFFLTGTDDNALKNVQAAEAAGKEITEYIKENAQHFIDLDKQLNIKYDDFIRTSVDERHRKGAEKLWLATKPDDLYKKSYRGFYCVGCEEFKTEKELSNGECHEHPGKMLEEVEEENYFFKLSAYQKQLEELIETDTIRIIPETRKRETLAFIRSGLLDFSVSRSALRAKNWGIPVPNDSTQYLYVWYDALANYITALGYADDSAIYKKFWEDADEKIHVIGKGINRFHTIYWPAMLLSSGLPLPKTIFIHGYITSEGQKMSKSVGNVIDPNDLLTKYGTDATRYLLLRHVHPTEDTDITWERLDEWYTANLVNGIGNLVARVMKLAEDNLESPVTHTEVIDPEFIADINLFKFNESIDKIFAMIAMADLLMTEFAPFKKVKSEDESEREEGKEIIRKLVKHLATIAVNLEPLMPTTSTLILKAVEENKKPENLFPRLA
jgi:methionyl-tRNA synthetase